MLAAAADEFVIKPVITIGIAAKRLQLQSKARRSQVAAVGAS